MIVSVEEKIMTVRMKHWQDPVNLVLGLWTMASPWVLSYAFETTPTRNAVIVGALIAGLAFLALYKLMAWEEWLSVALGAWLVASPWVLGFSGLVTAMWNAVIIGVVVAVLALWELGTDKQIGGWWSHA